tara:strand:- start:703 stop:2169 length:1467 start_codon:yes stop_codon:yes gene_type:complete
MTVLKKICILGGGTSGFATAAILSKYKEFAKHSFDITVIHNEKIGSIGGESTQVNINQLFAFLDVKDKEWMPKCNATYKIGTRFQDWDLGKYFFNTFGSLEPDPRVWFVAKDRYDLPVEKAAYYFLPSTVQGFTNKLIDEDKETFNQNTAYHFDSNLLGKYLKEYSEQRGVQCINAEVTNVLKDNGYIRSLVYGEQTIEADLFVDCSGFNSLLINSFLPYEDWISYDSLLNNKVHRATIPYKDKEEITNYTNGVALKNGWCWDIPLWDQRSVGYVHTNKFATQEEIVDEFFNHVGYVDYETIEFKSGRFNRGWINNVVSVGLSYGFIEPLEATGIASTLINAFALLECISRRDGFIAQIDRDLFNQKVGETLDLHRDFVELHYFLSSRSDSEYWRHITNSVTYNSKKFLRQILDDRNFPTDITEVPSSLLICAGMNYSPLSKDVILHPDSGITIDFDPDKFNKYIEDLENNAKDFPSSYKYLLDNVYS